MHEYVPMLAMAVVLILAVTAPRIARRMGFALLALLLTLASSNSRK